MHARDDALVPFAEGRLVATLIPGARFVALESRNHILLADEPAWIAFRAELHAFLGVPEVRRRDETAELSSREYEVLALVADGPTALAATVERSGDLTLATTISLVSLRGPVPLAKTLAALDVLSGGRLIAGVGPGSSRLDYDAVGAPFDERWPRFEQAVRALR